MSKTFVIRKMAYLYNDEYLFVHTPGSIENTFSTEEEAKSMLLKLEREAFQQISLSDIEALSGVSLNFIKEGRAFKAFCEKRFGEGIVKMDKNGNVFCEPGTQLPKELNDEDILEIRNILGVKFYELSEYEGTPVFYGIWLIEEGKFKDYCTAPYFFNSYTDASKALRRGLPTLLRRKKIEGTLEEISESPVLLKSLINSSDKLLYNETQKVLSMTRTLHEDEAIALNELLKEKLFEIREIPMSEVENIENDCYEIM